MLTKQKRSNRNFRKVFVQGQSAGSRRCKVVGLCNYARLSFFSGRIYLKDMPSFSRRDARTVSRTAFENGHT